MPARIFHKASSQYQKSAPFDGIHCINSSLNHGHTFQTFVLKTLNPPEIIQSKIRTSDTLSVQNGPIFYLHCTTLAANLIPKWFYFSFAPWDSGNSISILNHSNFLSTISRVTSGAFRHSTSAQLCIRLQNGDIFRFPVLCNQRSAFPAWYHWHRPLIKSSLPHIQNKSPEVL